MTSCISLHDSREFPCAWIGIRTMDGYKGLTRPIVVGHDDHDAAVRLLRTSLSCIVQHFVLPYVADAGSFCRSSHPHITLRCCSMTDVEGGQRTVILRHCRRSILGMWPVIVVTVLATARESDIARSGQSLAYAVPSLRLVLRECCGAACPGRRLAPLPTRWPSHWR